jgi:hypothetical protein
VQPGLCDLPGSGAPGGKVLAKPVPRSTIPLDCGNVQLVNVGFFRGAEIADPAGLLEGTGKFMRHVKLRLEVDAVALMELIATACADMKRRVQAQ